MIFKITFDKDDNPLTVELWPELSALPPLEKDAHTNGYKFDSTGWVDAESEEEALIKAKQIAH